MKQVKKLHLFGFHFFQHFTSLLAMCIPTVKDLDEKNLPCRIPIQGLSLPLLIIGKKITFQMLQNSEGNKLTPSFQFSISANYINMPQGILNLLLNPSGPKRARAFLHSLAAFL